MRRFDGSAWVDVGAPVPVPGEPGALPEPRLQLDANDQPWIAFAGAQNLYVPSMYRFDGTQWQQHATPDGLSGISYGNQLEFVVSPSGEPWLAVQRGGGFELWRFRGKAWSLVRDFGALLGTISMLWQPEGPLVAWKRAEEAVLQVEQLFDDGWRSLPLSPEAGGIHSGHSSIALLAGAPVVVYRDYYSAGGPIRVWRYSGGAWKLELPEAVAVTTYSPRLAVGGSSAFMTYMVTEDRVRIARIELP